MRSDSGRELIELPKAHLHIHLAQAMRPSTMESWAAADGVAVPRTGGFPDFGAFLGASAAVMGLLSSPGRVRRLIDEAVADAAEEKVMALELSFSPALYAAVFGGAELALELIAEYTAESSARHGVWTGLIVGVERHKGPEQAQGTAELAARFADRGVVGFGLYGDEHAYSPRDFAKAFAVAKDHGLLSVPHAGELLGPRSIRDALDALQADRIQHGVTAVQDRDLLAELAERGICLDVCPTSNLLLGVVDDLAHHPLQDLLRHGIRCSINADDPVLFGPGVAGEYEICRSEIGLTDEQLATCARNSIEASAAPEPVKARGAQLVDAWLARPCG